jgi:hypothetical protein
VSAPPLEVAPREILARFVLRPGLVRADGTLRADAFVPFRHVELSVTRHLDWTAGQLWNVGAAVAEAQGLPLVGRADVQAAVFGLLGLAVEADPLPSNLHHANVTGWPSEKPAQKLVALEVAARATYVPFTGAAPALGGGP